MTTVTDEAVTDAERYLAEVARHLGHLHAEEQAELLDDLNQHLLEIAAEPGPPLRDRLGPPEAYAAELLASAGVSAVPGPTGVTARLRSGASSLLAALAGSRLGTEGARLLPVLRPAWWLARGYLAVSFLAALSSSGSYPGFPVPALFGSRFLGLAAVALAVPLSVRLAERDLSRTGRAAVIAANTALLLFAFLLLDRAASPHVHYVDTGAFLTSPTGGCLSDGQGRPITNLYAYDAGGRLLDPVLLYDDRGRPVDNLCPEYGSRGDRLLTEYRADVNGAPVINAFPRRQSVLPPAEPGHPFEGGTAASEPPEPVAPPAVVVPRLEPASTAPTTSITTSPGPVGGG